MVPQAAACSCKTRRAGDVAGLAQRSGLDFYAGEFNRSGFRGPLNYYRNIDRNWELMAPFAGVKVTVPALYIAGDHEWWSPSPAWTSFSPT